MVTFWDLHWWNTSERIVGKHKSCIVQYQGLTAWDLRWKLLRISGLEDDFSKRCIFGAFNHQPWSGISWFCMPFGQLRWRFIIAAAKARTQKCDCTTYGNLRDGLLLFLPHDKSLGLALLIQQSTVDFCIWRRRDGALSNAMAKAFSSTGCESGNDLNRRQTRRKEWKDGIARWWFSITLENGYVNIYATYCIYILNISSAMLLPPQHWNFHKDQWRVGHPAGPTSLPSWFVIWELCPKTSGFSGVLNSPDCWLFCNIPPKFTAGIWPQILDASLDEEFSPTSSWRFSTGVPLITIGFPYQEWPITWIKFAKSGISLFWTPRSWPLFPVTYARRQCGGYCLAKGMKVSFIVTQGDKARSPQYVSPYLGLRKKAGD